MEKRGVDVLFPICHLINQRRNGIGLATDDVSVFYTTYVNDYKRPLQQDEVSIQEAFNAKNTPGIHLLDYFWSILNVQPV